MSWWRPSSAGQRPTTSPHRSPTSSARGEGRRERPWSKHVSQESEVVDYLNVRVVNIANVDSCDRRASGRAPRHPGSYAVVAANCPRPWSSCLALSQPPNSLSTRARPRPRCRRSRRCAGFAHRRLTSFRSPTRERENRDFADARDQPLSPASGRIRLDRPGARYHLDSHHVHLGNQRSLSLGRPRPALRRANADGNASRSTWCTWSLARRRRAQRRFDPNAHHEQHPDTALTDALTDGITGSLLSPGLRHLERPQSSDRALRNCPVDLVTIG
jgi:hypothetical protein